MAVTSSSSGATIGPTTLPTSKSSNSPPKSNPSPPPPTNPLPSFGCHPEPALAGGISFSHFPASACPLQAGASAIPAASPSFRTDEPTFFLSAPRLARPSHRHFERSRPTLFLSRLLL